MVLARELKQKDLANHNVKVLTQQSVLVYKVFGGSSRFHITETLKVISKAKLTSPQRAKERNPDG